MGTEYIIIISDAFNIICKVTDNCVVPVQHTYMYKAHVFCFACAQGYIKQDKFGICCITSKTLRGGKLRKGFQG